ncbi:PCI domain protein [Theileria parva strain Muguga]|uniref:PCI domain protein n=1 Tax=Theileria parva strain Muguga TaxID=333668 RepID=UPI001C61B602|nr:PCI domain protein [Theileria parva strain Muguga]EAN31748.2 PCI domain protein [Theileria parva strain Muguga]
MTTFVPLSQDTEGAVSSASLGDWVLGILKVRCPSKTATYYAQLLDQFQEVEGEQIIKESFQLFELLLSEHLTVFEFLEESKTNGTTVMLSLDPTSKAESEVRVKYSDALKQVEEYFTVLMYMLQLRFTSSGQIEKAGHLLLKAIQGGESFLELRLRLLQMLYNSVESTLPLRVDVYIAILEFAAKHNIFHTLIPIVKEVDEWMVDWSIDKKTKIRIYHIIAEELDKLNRADLAYKFWKKRVECLNEPDLYTTDENVMATVTFVVRSLRSEDILYFDQLLLMPAVAHLKETRYAPLISLLEIFIRGNLEDLDKYLKENAEFVSELKLDWKPLVEKLTLLTISTMCQQQSEIPIEMIEKNLQLPPEEAEQMIVNAINKGVMEALIDQNSKKVIINHVVHREFGNEELKQLYNNLKQWRNCINTLINIVDNKSLNSS